MRCRSALLVALVLCASSQVVAKSGKNVFRFGLFYAEPTGVETFPIHEEFGPPDFPFGVVVLDYRMRLEPSKAVGPELEYERRFGRRWGFALAVSTATHDVVGTFAGGGRFTPEIGPIEPGTVTGSLRGEFRATPLMAGVNVHVLTRNATDFYFGPFLAYVDYGDFKLNDGTVRAQFPSGEILETFVPSSTAVKRDTGLGANLGFDVPVGRRLWSISAGIRYYRTEIRFDVPDGRTMDVNPWSVRAGFARRF